MHHGLRIEKPVSADLESAYTVFELAIALAFDQEGVIEDATQEIAYKKSLIRQSVEENDSNTVFMVAKLDGRVIGTISFGPCGDDIRKCTNSGLETVGELGGLYVLPEYQGQGVGSALISEMLMYLHNKGVKQFCLDCGLKGAQKRWLRKFGEPYKVAKNYWGKDADHLIWLCDVVDYVQ